MGREHHRILQISFAQMGVRGLGQGKVGQAVVEQINGDAIAPKLVTLPHPLRRIGNDRLHAVALEQTLKQQEFRVQVLLLRRRIDDGDGLQRT